MTKNNITAAECRELMKGTISSSPKWYKRKVYKAIRNAAKEGYSGVNVKPQTFLGMLFDLYSEPQYKCWAKGMIKILREQGYNAYLKQAFYSWEKENQLSINWEKE